MVQNNSGGAPAVSDLESWTSNLGVEHPVLADVNNDTYPYVLSGFPTFVVIGRDMTILNEDMWPFDEDYIRDLVNAE
jgi:hypothetical protein